MADELLDGWDRTARDAEGKPIDGATIDVRIAKDPTDVGAGTVERPTLYEDAYATTTKSNPFDTLADGRARFFVAEGVYHVIVTDSTGSREYKNIQFGQGEEARRRIRSVISRTNGGPPSSPSNGDAYIVDQATGDWDSFSVDDVALYQSGRWWSRTPSPGYGWLWVDDEAVPVIFDGSWQSVSAVVDHDATTNFVADEHVDHNAVTISAGDGLTGGGDITGSRTFAVDGTVVRDSDKTGSDANVVSGTAGADGDLGKFNGDGDLIGSFAASDVARLSQANDFSGTQSLNGNAFLDTTDLAKNSGNVVTDDGNVDIAGTVKLDDRLTVERSSGAAFLELRRTTVGAVASLPFSGTNDNSSEYEASQFIVQQDDATAGAEVSRLVFQVDNSSRFEVSRGVFAPGQSDNGQGTASFAEFYQNGNQCLDVSGDQAADLTRLGALSSDPADPPAGQVVRWISDGTGTGDDGDVIEKIANTAGTVKTRTVVDFSAL